MYELIRQLPQVLIVAVALIAGQPPSTARANQLPALEFVEPDDVSFAVEPGRAETEPVTVWLRHAGTHETRPLLTLRLADAEGREVTIGKERLKVSGDTIVPAGGVARIQVALADPTPGEGALEGQLVATAEGVASATIDATLQHQRDDEEAINRVLVLPALVALTLVLARWGRLRVSAGKLVSEVDLDFTKGFASSLTLVGALLGTILAAGVLPEDAGGLSKEALTALNVVFGVLVVVAALVYAAAQRRVKEGDKWKLYGYVGTFMLASWLTTWAVLGELYCLWLIGDELDAADGFTGLAVDIYKATLLVAAVAMLVYLWRRMKQIATPGGEVVTDVQRAAARQPWSL